MDLMNEEELNFETIKRAKEGDRDAAVELIHLAMAGLYLGRVRSDVAFYLAEAFRQMLPDPCGDSFEEAFNLKRLRRRPKSKTAGDRNTLAAVWVSIATQRGMALVDAKACAAELWAIENIERTIRNEKVSPKDDGADLWDRVFLELRKPLPTRQ
jgi:hypothetical protein